MIMLSFPDLPLGAKAVLNSMHTLGYCLRRENSDWYMVPASQLGQAECAKCFVLDPSMIPEFIELGLIRLLQADGETYEITSAGRFVSRNRTAKS